MKCCLPHFELRCPPLHLSSITEDIRFKAEVTLSSSSVKVSFTDITISTLEKSQSLRFFEASFQLSGKYSMPRPQFIIVYVLPTCAATTICRCLTIISQAPAAVGAKCKGNLQLSSTEGTKHAFQYGVKLFRCGCDGLCDAKWKPVRRGKTMVTWPPSYPVTYLCNGNIFVHWKTYLCTEKIHLCIGKYIRALENIFVH